MKILPLFAAGAAVLLTGCVSHTQMGINKNEWHLLNEHQKENYRAHYRQIERFQRHRQYQPGASRIAVTISGGTVKMPPTFGSYKFYTTKFHLRDGQCQEVPLIAVENATQANVTACYTRQVLSIDPSRYKVADREGTLFLNYNPVWRHGFTYYGVNSTGYASLDDVNITVFAVAPKERR